MYLIECLNNERTKNCNTIYYIEGDFEKVIPFHFETSLEDVALLEEGDEAYLMSENKSYFIGKDIRYSNDFYLDENLDKHYRDVKYDYY